MRRDGGLGTMLAVSWKALGGNALAGVDFSPAEGTVMFDPAASAAGLQITLTNDTLVEGTEFALLALSVPAGAAALGPQATTTLTIGDRTPPAPIQFESATYSVLETAGVATISLVRAGNQDQPATVQYATTEGGTATAGVDYTPVTGTVMFPAGAARVHFDVPVLRDALGEGPETINLVLGATSAGSTLGARATAVLTIVDWPRLHFAEIATTGHDGFRSLALPVINDAGVVAYAGTLADGTMEIHTSDDSIVLATDESATIVPELALNNAGHLAFGGTLADGRRGVFRVSPTLMSIVALTGFASGEFRTFGSPSLNNRGDLVFSADVIGGSEALVRTTGNQLVTVADAGGNTFGILPAAGGHQRRRRDPVPDVLALRGVRGVQGRGHPHAPGRRHALRRGVPGCGPAASNATGRTAFIGLGASGEQRVLTLDASDQLQTTVTTASGDLYEPGRTATIRLRSTTREW